MLRKPGDPLKRSAISDNPGHPVKAHTHNAELIVLSLFDILSVPSHLENKTHIWENAF